LFCNSKVKWKWHLLQLSLLHWWSQTQIALQQSVLLYWALYSLYLQLGILYSSRSR
jgi:hypothetical protein